MPARPMNNLDGTDAHAESGSLLQHTLRKATRNAHQQLDHHPLLAPLIRHDLDLRTYGNALAALHGIQAASENAIRQALPNQYPFQPRLARLEQDLEALGRVPWTYRGSALSEYRETSHVMGLLYVTEGARLGAKVIHTQIARLLPDAPCVFFGTPEPQAAWARFCQYSASHCSQDDHAQAVNSAVMLFQCYLDHLDDCMRQA